MVAWLCALLVVVSGGLCLLGTTQWFTANDDSVWELLPVLAILAVITAVSGLVAAAAFRSRLAVHELGIVSTNAVKETTLLYADVSEMHVSVTPLTTVGKTLNPWKPHLVISSKLAITKKHYLCPFLIPDSELFATAVEMWESSKTSNEQA